MTMPRISIFLLAFPALFVIGCQSTRPANLGVHDGKLAACPETPNCVSSAASDAEHRIAPLHYAGSAAEALVKLKAIIRSIPRTAVITETDDYLHIECTSLIFRFVDDVELLVDDTAKVIHVRSASRLGTSDLGVNRKRVELIRKRWLETAH
jgi:uncharacterized protein (DUF1499 family)